MESKPKGFLLRWKLRSLRILVAVVLVFLALFLTYLNIRGYYRNPDSFTVKAVFPVGLYDVMEMAKQRDFMPSGIVTIPGEVWDLVDANIVEAYRIITCFPTNENGSWFGIENACSLELYAWRGDGLPTLYVKIKEPLAFVDQADYKLLPKPPSYNKYYAFFSTNRSAPEVSGNVIVQTFHKTPILTFLSLSALSTVFRLFLARGLYKIIMWHEKEYRADMGVYDF